MSVAPVGPVRSVRRNNVDPDGIDRHALACMDLAGLAQLHHAVHAHHSAGDELLAGATAVAQARDLEQLVEFDEVAIEFESDELHGRFWQGWPSVAAGSRIRKQSVTAAAFISDRSTPHLRWDVLGRTMGAPFGR